METATWGQVLQNVTPNQGPSPLPLGDYNFKVLMGRGQTASTGKEMISVQFEVIDGPSATRKTWHNWVMPDFGGDPEKAATSLGYFLGDMEIFGLAKDWFIQALSGQPINKQTCDYIAQQLIGRAACATVTEQKNDKRRRNISGFRQLDPTLATMQAPGAVPQAAGFPGAAPQVGSPFGAPPVAQPQFGAPPMPAQQAPQAPAAQPQQQFQPGQMPAPQAPQAPQIQQPMAPAAQMQPAQPQQFQFPQAAPPMQPPAGPQPQQFAPPAQQQFQAPPAQPVAPQPQAPVVPQAPAPQGFPGAPVQPPAVSF